MDRSGLIDALRREMSNIQHFFRTQSPVIVSTHLFGLFDK